MQDIVRNYVKSAALKVAAENVVTGFLKGVMGGGKPPSADVPAPKEPVVKTPEVVAPKVTDVAPAPAEPGLVDKLKTESVPAPKAAPVQTDDGVYGSMGWRDNKFSMDPNLVPGSPEHLQALARHSATAGKYRDDSKYGPAARGAFEGVLGTAKEHYLDPETGSWKDPKQFEAFQNALIKETAGDTSVAGSASRMVPDWVKNWTPDWVKDTASGLANQLTPDWANEATSYMAKSELNDKVVDKIAASNKDMVNAMNAAATKDPKGTGFLDWIMSDPKSLLIPAGFIAFMFGGDIGKVLGGLAMVGGAANLYGRYQNLKSPETAEAIKASMVKDENGVVHNIDLSGIEKFSEEAKQGARDFFALSKFEWSRNMVARQVLDSHNAASQFLTNQKITADTVPWAKS